MTPLPTKPTIKCFNVLVPPYTNKTNISLVIEIKCF